jgi:DNA-binding SARP family transcriptional activator
VLAVLAAKHGNVVPAETLLDEIWGSSPPASAIANLRTYISSLRSALIPAGARIETRSRGYQLFTEPAALDWVVFSRLVSQGLGQVQDGDASGAGDTLKRALDLLRGQPYEDVDAGPVILAHTGYLRELIASAREGYAGTLIEAGSAGQAVQVLREHVAENPLREHGWWLLISALHSCAGAAEALGAFEQARHALAEGLGLDPGPRLAELQLMILRQRPAAPGQVSPAGPSELPAAPAAFTGRETPRSQAAEMLRGTGQEAVGAARVIVVSGPAGYGKSAFALRVAHDIASSFPGGQLYVDMLGNSPGVTAMKPLEALSRFMRALGRAREIAGLDLNEAAARFRSAVAGRQMLIVLDNTIDASAVRPLIPANERCAVIVTSRHRQTTLDGAIHFDMSTLTGDEAVSLLMKLAGEREPPIDGEVARRVSRLCGGLPLALRVAGLRMSTESAGEIRSFADRLDDERSRLDQLGLDDVDVRSTFSLSYQSLLNDRKVPAASLFGLLGVLRVPEFGVDVAAALLSSSDILTAAALARLRAAGLVEGAGGRYRMHDLMALYSQEIAQSISPAGRQTAVTAVLHRFLLLAQAATSRYRPGTGVHTADEPPATAPVTAQEAVAWIERHHPVLVALCAQVVHSSDPAPAQLTLVLALTRAVYPLLPMRHPTEWLKLCDLAGCAAEKVGDAGFTDWARVRVAAAYNDLDRPDCAAPHAQAALPGLRSRDDAGLATGLQIAAITLVRTGKPAEAIDLFTEATALAYVRGDEVGIGTCLSNTAEALLALDRDADGLAVLRRSLAIRRRYNDNVGEGITLNNIAEIYLRSRNWAAAVSMATAALRRSREVNHVSVQLQALRVRGEALLSLGQTGPALADAQAAVTLCESAGLTHLEAPARHQLARVLGALGDPM